MPSTQTKPPRLSVIIAVFNGRKTIKDCLRAVRASAFTDYELIVADDGSTDGTPELAAGYADKVLKLAHAGRTWARLSGVKAAAGGILVNIDSDVVIRPDTLGAIHDFLEENPQADALTGCLARHTPGGGYFTQYKNLYMHHIFQGLPARVSFLYGSIYATRRALWAEPRCYLSAVGRHGAPADDTELGQLCAAAGKHIAFLKDLQVIHLKEYSPASFFKNDFDIPFGWAQIFLAQKGWRQLGRSGTGFCHSPRGQLLSVILAPLLPLAVLAAPAVPAGASAPPVLAAGWLALNLRFLAFLSGEKGLSFGLRGALVTYFDNLIMAAGIACGLAAYIFKKRRPGAITGK